MSKKVISVLYHVANTLNDHREQLNRLQALSERFHNEIAGQIRREQMMIRQKVNDIAREIQALESEEVRR